LPYYSPPKGAFTPGSNGVGVIHSVGRDVWHLKTGQRVVISTHIMSAENVSDPAQILLGLTSFGPGSEIVQDDWRNGTLAEYVLLPAASVTPVDGLDHIDSAHLIAVSRFVIPFGGLLRGRLSAGETVVVIGATGAYGSAAVLLALAMGAARVVAAGRNKGALEAISRAGGPRVVTAALTGDVQFDVNSLRAAANGGAHLAFDMVGNALDSNATVAALRSLRRNGRLVLMGSMTSPLTLNYGELMANNWEIMGQFMYPVNAYQRLIDFVRAGTLDVSLIQPRVFPLTALPDALETAATAGNLEIVVMTH